MFLDRKDAGHKLSEKLSAYRKQKNVEVFGLARGGVIVAAEVAKTLTLPLGVIVVRKIGAPLNEELALGAITESGDGIFNEDLIRMLGVSKEFLQREIQKQKRLAEERLALYHGQVPEYAVKDKTIILVDDGIATGASMRVAIVAMKKQGAKKIIVAVPVAAPDAIVKIKNEVDDVICLYAPAHLGAVGAFYENFGPTLDEDIIQLFKKRTL